MTADFVLAADQRLKEAGDRWVARQENFESAPNDITAGLVRRALDDYEDAIAVAEEWGVKS